MLEEKFTRRGIFSFLPAGFLATWLGLSEPRTPPSADPTIQSNYGTNNQAFTITFTSLATGAVRGSASVDNTTNLFLDALVMVKVKTNAAGTSGTGYVNVYAYASADSGTTFSDSVTGTDAVQTLTSPPNLKLIGVVNCVANATTYVGGPFSVAAAFGGIMPQKWGICIENQTGAALDASVGNAFYQGVQAQSV